MGVRHLLMTTSKSKKVAKPLGLREVEWIEIQRAHSTGFFRYVVLSRFDFWPAAIFSLVYLFPVGVYFHSNLETSFSDGMPPLKAIYRYQFFSILILWGVICASVRTMNYFARRKTARIAGL